MESSSTLLLVANGHNCIQWKEDLRKICDPVQEQYSWRIRTNKRYRVYKCTNLENMGNIKFMKSLRVRCYGHSETMIKKECGSK